MYKTVGVTVCGSRTSMLAHRTVWSAGVATRTASSASRTAVPSAVELSTSRCVADKAPTPS